MYIFVLKAIHIIRIIIIIISSSSSIIIKYKCSHRRPNFRFAVLYYAMSCCAIITYSMLRNARSCYLVPCHFMLCYVM